MCRGTIQRHAPGYWKIYSITRTIFIDGKARSLENVVWQEQYLTMTKTNCWEYKECGREPGGEKVEKMGLCPASVEVRVTGINAGSNGGRVCWAIPGTFCGWQLNGTYADKLTNCHNCKFYKMVGVEEGSNFVGNGEIVDRLRDEKGNLPW